MDESRTICFCNNVPLGKLLETIEAGAHTLEAIKLQTKASTGCGGCEAEVLEILENWLKEHAAEAAATTGK